MQKQLLGASVSFRSRSSHNTALGAVLPSASVPHLRGAREEGNLNLSPQSHIEAGETLIQVN